MLIPQLSANGLSGETRRVTEDAALAFRFEPQIELVDVPFPVDAEGFAALDIPMPQNVWPMQEWSGDTVASDVVGEMHLTASNIEAQLGAHGLRYQGSNEARRAWELQSTAGYLRDTDESNLRYNDRLPWALFTWLRAETPWSLSRHLLGVRDDSAQARGWELKSWTAGGSLYFRHADWTGGVTSTVITGRYSDRAWHPILICYDGAGSYRILTDQTDQTIAVGSYAGDGVSTRGLSFGFRIDGDPTIIGVQFPYACGWHTDITSDAARILDKLRGGHGQAVAAVPGSSYTLSITAGAMSPRASETAVMPFSGDAGHVPLEYDPKTLDDHPSFGFCCTREVINLCRQSSPKSSGASAWNNGAASISYRANKGPRGHKVAASYASTTANDFCYYNSDVGAGDINASYYYVWQGWLKGAAGQNIRIAMDDGTGAGEIAFADYELSGEWDFVWVGGQAGGAQTNMQCRIYSDRDGTALPVLFDCWQLTERATVGVHGPRPLVETDGANASAAATILRFDDMTAGTIRTKRGAIDVLVTLRDDAPRNAGALFRANDGTFDDTNGIVCAYSAASTKYELDVFDNGGVQDIDLDSATAVAGGLNAEARVRAAWIVGQSLGWSDGNSGHIKATIPDIPSTQTDTDTEKSDNHLDTITSIVVGSYNDVSFCDGIIKRVKIFKGPIHVDGE